MASIISAMLQQLFHKTEYRCLTIGLDAAGKTTMLYKIKLGEVVTTIPTIGFNVETVDVGNVSFTIWDVGGCDKIRPLWRHYYQNTQALIFIADVNDLLRFDEVLQLFVDTVTADELRDAVILLFFNKIDLVSPAQLQAYKKKFLAANGAYLRRHTHFVQDCCAPRGDGLLEGFTWLADALSKNPRATTKPAVPEPTEKDRLETQLEEWLSRTDEPDEVFLAQLADYTLDSWDHYTHLRIAYILLRKHGRRDGMSKIFAGIKAFIENSPRTKRSAGADGTPNRGTTFHETMTYFWVHMVHYALESSRVMKEATSKGTGAGSASAMVPVVGGNEWKVFLLMNPQLANGGLFLHYYSKQRMLLDPDSRTMVLLPDKLPLPSLLVDVNKAKSSAAAIAAATDAAAQLPRSPLSDSQFLTALVEGKLPGWGHEVMLRVVYLLLCRWGVSSKSDDAILDVLRGIEKAGFHYSIDYFWIQLVTYHIAIEAKAQATATKHAAQKTYFAAFNDPLYTVPGEMTLFKQAQPPLPPLPATTDAPPTVSVPASVNVNDTVATATVQTNDTESGESDWVSVPGAEQLQERPRALLQALLLTEQKTPAVPLFTTSAEPNNPTIPAPAVTPSATAAGDTNRLDSNDLWLERNMPFAEFLLRPHCQPLRNPLLYSKYYSRKVLDAPSSSAGLALPDLKQFPSVV